MNGVACDRRSPEWHRTGRECHGRSTLFQSDGATAGEQGRPRVARRPRRTILRARSRARSLRWAMARAQKNWT